MNTSPPFAWSDKRARRLIRERTTEHTRNLAAYDALAEQASNAEAQVFTISHAHLQTLCGLKRTAFGLAIADLEGAGAIGVKTPPLRTNSTFTLRAVDASGQDFIDQPRTLDVKRPALPVKRPTLPVKQATLPAVGATKSRQRCPLNGPVRIKKKYPPTPQGGQKAGRPNAARPEVLKILRSARKAMVPIPNGI